MNKETFYELLAIGTGAPLDYNQNETFIDAFLHQVEKTPDATAVVDEYGSITYWELDRRSDFIAAELLKMGVKSGDFVAVKLPRVKEFLVAVLGIWKAGGAYIPVDPTYPEERIRYMMEDSGAKVTIDESWMEMLRTDGGDIISPVNNARADSVAIIIYTSGSTGCPKGVLNTHSGVRALCSSMNSIYQYAEGDVIAEIPSFSYVISCSDLFPPLIYGHAVFILNHSLLADIAALDRYIREKGITIITIVPQIGIPLINDFNTPLRAIGMGGAKVELSKQCDIRIISGYGLSETCSAVSFVDLLEKSAGNGPLLGCPTPGVTMVLEDEDGNPVQRGEIGEVCIGSPQVAAGYWHKEELTESVFVKRPWSEYRVFRSGDLARWNEDGVLEFHGRKDDMVKIRGNRVELGEVESVLLKVKGVRAGTVAMKEVCGESMLCSYYVSSEPVSSDFLRASMSEFLPPYMIPSFFVRLAALPKLPNGKLDRLSLPVPDVSISEKSENIVAPESDFERKVFPIVVREVGTENLGVTTNLISLGLTSLRAIRLSAAMKSGLGLDIPQAELLAHPVIREWESLCRAESQTIPVGPVRECYPLTDNQTGLYMEWERSRDADMYNLPFILKIKGGDAQRLITSVRETVNMYPILKMHIGERDGSPVQMRRDDAILPVGFDKLDFEPDDGFFCKLVRPFNLTEEDLARFNVYSSPSAVWLFFDVHHIIFDGGSVNLFLNAVSSLYRGIAPSGESVTVYDYSLYREKWQGSEEFAEFGRYFEKLLEGTESFNYPSMKNGTSGGPAETVTVTLPREGIRSFCSGFGVTENSFFATVLTQVFHRVSREDCIQMAMFSSGRSMTDLSGSIGMFVQTLPLVSRAADGTVGETLWSIHSQIVETLSRDKYPYTLLSERFGVKPNVMYVYQGDLIDDADFGGAESEWHRLPVSSAISPLTVEILPEAEEYRIKFEYDGGLYGEKDMELLSRVVRTLAERMADSPETAHLGTLSMVSEEEKMSMLTLGIGEKLDFDINETLVDLFRRSVAANPDNEAVVFRGRSYTYREVDEITDRIASQLQSMGVGVETVIGVMIDRSERMVLYPMAIMKCGGTYMPLDITYPEGRLEGMCEDASVGLIITEDSGDGETWVSKKIGGYAGRVVIEPENIQHDGNPQFVTPHIRHDNRFVILYTSGSTGKPKGVELMHQGIVNFCYWYVKEFRMVSSDKSLAYASFGFDAHMMDIYPALSCGACVHILPTELRLDINAMSAYMEDVGITIAFLTTQLGHLFASTIDYPALRLLSVSGEKLLPVKKPRYVLYNAGAPTECTIYAFYYEITEDYVAPIIGKAMDNVNLYVVDRSMNLVPQGMAGELLIGGRGVGRGYLNKPEMTAERYIMWNGERVYRTGDLCFWDEDGLLEYIGRIDHQVKLRGFRIEMGEIESTLSSQPGVTASIVMVKSVNGDDRLVAYYTSNGASDKDAIREAIGRTLAAYMVPDIFIRLDKMPLTPNGKIDRRRLPEPETEAAETVAPESDLEKKMFSIVASELKTENFGVTTNLITLGLASIRAIRLSVAIRKETGLVLRGTDMISHPTIREWCNMGGSVSERIETAPVREYYPLTDNQLGVYVDCEQHRDGIQYNVPSALKFIGTDARKLVAAVRDVISCHPYLKTRMEQVDDAVMQHRRDDADIPVLCEHLEEEPSTSFFQSRVRPFNLLGEDMARFEVYACADATYLFYDIHHIIFDGGAANVFLSDLSKSLSETVLEHEQVNAFDYALHYDGWKKSERFSESERYFDSLVSDTESFLYPVSRQTDLHPEKSGRCATRRISVPTERIRQYCRSLSITENVYFATVLTQVFHRISREETIQIATVSNGRSMEQLSDTMGMFVQTLPLVSRKSKGISADILRDMQSQIFDTVHNEKYPFTRLSERHGTKPNILYVYQGDVINYDAFSGLGKVETVPLSLDTAKTPIILNVFPEGDCYSLVLEYDEGMYSESDMGLLCNALSVFSTSLAVKSPEEDISSVGLTSPSEEISLTALGTGEKLDYDRSETFVDQFLRSVRQYPDSVAVVDATSSITYHELDEKSNVLASRLIELGVGKDSFVAIMLPRVKEFEVAVLGVWKAGGAYLPLGSEYPKERLKFMLEDAEAAIMITESGIWSEMSDAGLPAKTVIKLDEFFSNIHGWPTSVRKEAVNRATADGLAYMIYTSGSTGKPKGTMLEHRNLRAFNQWLVRSGEIGAGDAISVHASFSFDGSCLDLYPALTVGGQVHILSKEVREDMSLMDKYFRENHIKGCFLTARLAGELLNSFDLSLDYLMAGGEKVLPFRPCGVRVMNAYGPTECTILSTCGLIDQSFPAENIPLGRPVPNTYAVIVDASGNMVPRGMEGELCLCGPQIARGYWKRPELTAEKFCGSPFYPGERMYRTGDIAFWNEKDELVCLGRTDDQIKLRGFRIELGEIEAAMSSYPGILSAVSDVREIYGISHLCAWYVSREEIDESSLRAFLSDYLTDYMVPESFVRMDKMPMTVNMKVDRKALPNPEMSERTYTAPENETEQKIAEAFRDSLNLSEPVGRDDGFYALGGDSIKAIRVVSRLRQEGLTLTVAQIIKFQTVSRLAEIAGSADDGEDFSEYFDMMTVPVEESFSSADEYESIRAEFEKRGETIERAYPLTSMQEGMLLTALSEPESSAYHITFRISLGILPTEKQLSYALEKLLSKREVLRTAIIHNAISEPRQAIISGRRLPLTFEDLSTEKDIDAATLAYDRREFGRKIDLQWDPLFRCTCIKTGEDSCQLLFTAHHAIIDGWCTALWMGDLFTYLTEAVTGMESEEDFSEGYGRYERHVRDIISRDREEALNYWKELLSGYETKAEIPAYEKVTEANRSVENEIKVSLSADTTGKLEKLCRENGCTISNAVEAAWGLVLQAYNRTDDAVFVKVVSGRDNSREDMSDVLGLFINSVPVRVKREENSTLIDIVKGCQHQAADTSSNDWVPLSEIQQQSELGSNLFQSILAFENFETGSVASSSSEDVLKARLISGHETNISEVTVSAYVGGESLILDIKYDVEKYTAASIERVIDIFRNILCQMADSPSMKVSALQLTDEETARKLVTLGTGEKLDYDMGETFIDMFLRNVSTTPDAAAAVDYKSSLTYRELDAASDALASKLVSDGVGTGDFIAVKMPRVKEFIVAVLGIWKAGGAYVPVDPEYPEDRINYMLEDSGAKVLIDPEYLVQSQFNCVCTKPLNLARPENPAYMIYTSGSTGEPKGVVVTHANLRAFLAWIMPLLSLRKGDAVAEYVSFSFDGSIADLYPPLASGASVHILSSELRRDMAGLDAYFRENRIKGLVLISQIGAEMLNTFDLSLEYLLIGGERVPQFRPCGVRVINVYGPTECTDITVYGVVDQSFPLESVPIGRPVPNSVSLILDAFGNLVPRGMAGELCLSGDQLSAGYWHRPELTQEVFVSCKSLGGAKIYRTGDLARWNENGELEYLGRIDNQVKLRGFRIEMGEIESALSKFDGITSAVAEVKTVNGIQHLCAYYVSDTEIDETALKSELSKSLTEYMIPDAFMHLESLLLTPGGKVDRRALPLPDVKGTVYVAPINETEQTIADAFRESLNLSEPVGREDGFYALGGDSIKAIRMVSRLRQEGMTLTVAQIIKFQTVSKLAEIAGSADDGEDFSEYFDMMTIPVEESFSSPEEYESVRAEFEKRGETIERAYPLTSMQEGMLLKALSEPESSAYHITTHISLGILPTEAQLSYAIGKLLSKREVLRTVIIHQGVAEPRQAIISGGGLPLLMMDISGEKDIESAVRTFEQQEFDRKIDLQRDSLFRCLCLKTGAENCQLLFTSHHTLLDGWCSALWMGDFFTYLTEAVTGNEHIEDFSEGHGRYERHVRDILSRDREEALNYWKELLSGYETKAEIPAYEKVTEQNRSSENEIKVSLSNELTGKLEKLCRESGCTVSNAVEAAWGLVLQAYNRTDDAVFVKVVSGRDNSQEDMSDVVGLFINSVPVRVKREENSTLIDIVKGCQHQAADTSANDWVSLSEIQQQSGLGSNLFQSILAFENFETGSAASSSSVDVLKAKVISGHETNVSEIAVAAYVGGESLILDIKYDVEKYTVVSIERVIDIFRSILCQMADSPSMKVSSLQLTDRETALKLVALGTGEKLDYDRIETFVDQFLRSVRLYPDSVAVVDATSSITYRELDEKSNALASRLIELGVGKDTFVAIMLPRVKEFYVAVLGVWKAGGAYLPLGGEYPKVRLKFMLEDAETSIMITESGIWSEMSDAGLPASNVIKLDEFDSNTHGWPTSVRKKAVNLARPENPAYMIYTSGSTGKPKGVVVTHANLRAFSQWRQTLTQAGHGEAFAHHTSFSFDASMDDIVTPLSSGASVHILSEAIRKDLDGIVTYLKEHRIVGMTMPTRLGVELLNSSDDLPLRYLMMGGEKLPAIHNECVTIINGYGPTEFTVCATYHIVDQTKDGENIPIGRPVPNSVSLILDAFGNMVPRGMAGELCLSGAQLSAGYWHRPELTAEKFVEAPKALIEGQNSASADRPVGTQSPLGVQEGEINVGGASPRLAPGLEWIQGLKAAESGAGPMKIYRTGDLARWNEEGELEYLGRIDNQVKLRGFRIEMGEIESALSKFEGITSVVAEVKTVCGAQHLCAYYVSDTGIDESALESELSKSLAEYMVPDVYVRLESMPLTPNGKVDRKALALPELKEAEYVAPETEQEKIICTVFGEILGIPEYGATQDFFKSGGTSLICIRAVAGLQREKLDVVYGDIFKYKTPRALADFISGKGGKDDAAINIFNFGDYDYTSIDSLLSKTPDTILSDFAPQSLGTVLLTGVTGFLGIHVLCSIMEMTDSNVILLIRPRPWMSCEERLTEVWIYYMGFPPELYSSRISYIEGDITDVTLGDKLSTSHYDTVINCAAYVRHFAADDIMDRINVKGVRNLIECCAECGARLVHISTYSTGGLTPAVSGQVFDERHLYIGQISSNDYVRTKFMAERYVLEAVADGRIRGKVMRLGNLMGRRDDGEFQINVRSNAFVNMLRSLCVLGCVSSSQAEMMVEMSPIDYVALAVTILSGTPDNMYVFHPYSPFRTKLSSVIDAMVKAGHRIEIVPEDRFAARIEEIKRDSHKDEGLQGIFHYQTHAQAGFRSTETVNDWTVEVLEKAGFKWKPAGGGYLDRFIGILEEMMLFEDI